MLAQLFAAGAETPYNKLEGSFMNLSAPKASMAYAESLAAVEYIRDTYGMSDVQRILESLSHGSLTETALRSVIRSDYRQMRDEMAAWLASRYGK